MGFLDHDPMRKASLPAQSTEGIEKIPCVREPRHRLSQREVDDDRAEPVTNETRHDLPGGRGSRPPTAMAPLSSASAV